APPGHGAHRERDDDRGEHHGLGERVAHLLRVCGADERRATGAPAGNEEHDVDAVGDHREADDHPGQAALEQQVDPGADEDGDEDDECQARGGVDHGLPPGRSGHPEGTASGAASPAVTSGESKGTSGATSPSRSPCLSTSAPSVRRMSSTRPTTTRYTPMSKNRVVTRCSSPIGPRSASNIADWSTSPPKNSGTAPAPADRNRPEPSSQPACTGAASP